MLVEFTYKASTSSYK